MKRWRRLKLLGFDVAGAVGEQIGGDGAPAHPEEIGTRAAAEATGIVRPLGTLSPVYVLSQKA